MPPPAALYVYAVLRARGRVAPARVPPGLPGAGRPRVVSIGRGLSIVAADVPLDRYGPAALEPRLRDVQWVSAAALAHEAVVERFARARGVTLLPMKLFTLFSSADRAAAEINASRAGIDRAMQRIAGGEEWGVRIVGSEPAGPPPRGRAPDAARGTGAGFLAARKAARDAVRDARVRASAAAEQAFEALTRLAREARPRTDFPAGATNPPILEAAFLVSDPAEPGVPRRGTPAGRGLPACGRQADPHWPLAGLQLREGERMTRSKGRGRPPRQRLGSTMTRSPHPAAPHPPRPSGTPARLPRPRARRVAARPKAARIIPPEEATLLDMIDNLLNKGVVLNADLILALANVDLVVRPPVGARLRRRPGAAAKPGLMALYVFALLDRAPGRRAGPGLTSPISIRAVPGGFAAVERRADVPPPEFGLLRAHDAAVARLSRLVPAILPVRFGTLLDEEALEDALAGREGDVEEALELVRRRVQFTWRARGRGTGPGRAPVSRTRVRARSGADYLRRAAAAAHPAPPASFRRLTPLAPLVAAERHTPPTAVLPASMYHLVDRSRLTAYEAAARALAASARGLSLSGPFPPYAFAPELL